MSDKKWYEVEPLSNLIEAITDSFKRIETNEVIDQSLRIMKDHTLRNNTHDQALQELETVATKLVAVRKKVSGALSTEEVSVSSLPTAEDISSIDKVEDVKAVKKHLASLIGKCDKRISGE